MSHRQMKKLVCLNSQNQILLKKIWMKRGLPCLKRNFLHKKIKIKSIFSPPPPSFFAGLQLINTIIHVSTYQPRTSSGTSFEIRRITKYTEEQADGKPKNTAKSPPASSALSSKPREPATYLGCLRCWNHMDSTGFDAVGFGSFVESKPAFPTPSVTVRKGAIVPKRNGNTEVFFFFVPRLFVKSGRKSWKWIYQAAVKHCTWLYILQQ